MDADNSTTEPNNNRAKNILRFGMPRR